MAGIPFFHLALLPQIEILKHVPSKDLFVLSLISARCKNLVKSARRSIENVTIKFDSEEHMEMSVEKGEEKDFLLGLHKKSNGETFRGVDKMDIGSLFYDELEVPVGFYEVGCYHEMEKRVILHLFSVFKKVENVSIVLVDVESVLSNVVWNYIKRLECLYVSIGNRTVTPEELKFLFEELTVSDEFCFSAKEFEYQNGFTHNDLLLEIPQLTNMDAVISSKSSKIHIRCPWPSATELNRLLKAWIAGGNMENLKNLSIVTEVDVSQEFKEEVLDGITIIGPVAHGSFIRSVDGNLAAIVLDGLGFRLIANF